MKVTYEDIKPYLYQINFDSSHESICEANKFFIQMDRCKSCPFGSSPVECNLDRRHNPQLNQLIEEVKYKHPELFI